MNSDVQKPPRRWALKSRWSWLTRPGTFRLAIALVRLVTVIAKVIDKLL